ncbi:alpha-amylase family glycosyl hydrolase [Luteolibacter algae]|uniref:Alpha-amylase family glycosyl hydrolase n=1 Tax=Luteolibacter algae TaxID=454151 RepID=A0ABW5D7N9_9BACT
MVRTFGNKNPHRIPSGNIEENGCGKFKDIDDNALESISKMGFTHIWLTGVIEQACGTSYPGIPADPPDILKGKAGSPYAIKDYFDVCPDYAEDPECRLKEFQQLLDRCHNHGFKVLIDFVPNHVARSYRSDVYPKLSFGQGDNRNVFFDRDNHFYYLDENSPGGGPPLRLPTREMSGCSGLFEQETEFGRVTGNNAITWQPSINDWYETVKLNYGHDFTTGRATQHLPDPDADLSEVPRTWATMDGILEHWQRMGVDGFRVDMAHIVPMEFWQWLVKRARSRDEDVFFMAEAYDNDPDKLTDGDVLQELVESGFDGAYEHPTYKILQGIYENGKWANDIDPLTMCGERFHRCVRYLENHDEVRIANPKQWGGAGMDAGRPATGVMFGISRANLMLYHGQEIGEPAIGAEGFCGDDGRTSIFDYTSMPEFQKWVNGGKYDGGRLSDRQKSLRAWYGRLLEILKEPAFEHGEFYGLNHANKGNHRYGRLAGEEVSGHWLYSFLRTDPASGQCFLCMANFHPSARLDDVVIDFPENALEFIGRRHLKEISFTEMLEGAPALSESIDRLIECGLHVGNLEPFSVRYYELK